MRRVFAGLVLIIFVFSAWLGFGLAGSISHAASQAVVYTAPPDQFNFLYFSLSGSETGSPHPVSAWVALVRMGPTPVLFFKKLFPLSSTAQEWKEIQKSFQTGAAKIVPAKLEQKISDLQLTITETFVLDRSYLPGLAALVGISSEVFPKFVSSDESLLDTAYMQAICQILTSDPGLRPEAMAVSSLMDPWKGLVTSLHFSSCEVLVDP